MKPSLMELAVKDVIPTPENTRKPIDTKSDSIKELAKSIESNGLLQPVICRPHPEKKGKYDLRAGARRFAAVKYLKQSTILAMVSDMTDVQALEVTCLENLQREDLSPLEEAGAVLALLNTGMSAKDIADDVGKSVRWIYRRASLAQLISPFRDALETGNIFPRWTVAHFELIAKYKSEQQHQFFTAWHDSEYTKNMSVKDLKSVIVSRFCVEIKNATDTFMRGNFLKACPDCNACPKNSLAQPELFGDDAKTSFECFDPDCHENKVYAFNAWRFAQWRKAHPDTTRNKLITDSWDDQQMLGGETALGRLEYDLVNGDGEDPVAAFNMDADPDKDPEVLIEYRESWNEKEEVVAEASQENSGNDSTEPANTILEELEEQFTAFRDHVAQKVAERPLADVNTKYCLIYMIGQASVQSFYQHQGCDSYGARVLDSIIRPDKEDDAVLEDVVDLFFLTKTKFGNEEVELSSGLDTLIARFVRDDIASAMRESRIQRFTDNPLEEARKVLVMCDWMQLLDTDSYMHAITALDGIAEQLKKHL